MEVLRSIILINDVSVGFCGCQTDTHMIYKF